MKNIIVFLSISIASGILFVNLYTSLIDAKSWGSDIPNSIAAAREYFKAVNAWRLLPNIFSAKSSGRTVSTNSVLEIFSFYPVMFRDRICPLRFGRCFDLRIFLSEE